MKLTWTTDKPRAAGYYWVRAKNEDPQILKFEWWDNFGRGRELEPTAGRLSASGWEEFAGPIKAPVRAAARKGGQPRRSAGRAFQACNRAKSGAFPFT